MKVGDLVRVFDDDSDLGVGLVVGPPYRATNHQWVVDVMYRDGTHPTFLDALELVNENR